MLPVKVCGITRAEDALLAADLGASAVGFVFYPKSPRCVDADEVRRIGDRLPAHVARVGVFVNPDPETLLFTAEIARLTHIQLAGDETPELCRLAPLPVIKTVRHGPDTSLKALENFPAAAFLLDSYHPGEYGGTGETADWSVCRELRTLKITILAGGLSSDNVAAAVAAGQPDALDLSSALERSQGVKDPDKMRAFFATVGSLTYPGSRMSQGFLQLV